MWIPIPTEISQVIFFSFSLLVSPIGHRPGLWHPCPKWHAEGFPWHAAFTVVLFVISFARPASLYCEECVYVHSLYISFRCYQITQQVKYFHTNREQCEELTGYLPLGRRAGVDQENTWQQWTERFKPGTHYPHVTWAHIKLTFYFQLLPYPFPCVGSHMLISIIWWLGVIKRSVGALFQ